MEWLTANFTAELIVTGNSGFYFIRDQLKLKAKVNSRTLCSHGAYVGSRNVITIATDIGSEVQVHGWGVGGKVQRVDDGSVRENLSAFKAESTNQPLRSRNARKAHVLYF